jgi:UDP-N-acetylmuramoylalanine--D-glutamate ligase
MIKSKNITILGSGISGLGSAKLANKLGLNVFVSDNNIIGEKIKKYLKKNKIGFEENGHDIERLLSADQVIISPGISFVDLKKRYPEINKEKFISEIEFASRFTNAYLIAVTGSNGKTTTASLIYHILKSSGFNVGLAGNIGVSFAESVCNFSYDFYVLEVSSFQLDHISNFRPNISIITNISADHLDRYDYKFENYVKSKYRIVKNQKNEDYFIYNGNCIVTKKILKTIKINSKKFSFSLSKSQDKHSQIYLDKNHINSLINKKKFMLSTNKIPIKGKHNLQNSMAAISVAQILKISNEKIKESFKTFKSIPHRLEHFLTIQKVKYINDSKATNVNSVFYALDSFKEPIIWIAGGVDKGNQYDDLIPLVKNKVKAIICLGQDNNKLIDVFSSHTDLIVSTDNIADVVSSAYKISKPGDVVLLSPACASFDLFKNFEDRGNKFKEEVRKL